MVICFWLATGLLGLCACGFVLPWLRSFRTRIIVGSLLFIGSYALYQYWGSAHHLTHYYANEEQAQRQKQMDFRKLLAEFRKQEFRLRFRLEENPNDTEAEWRLLDLLGIKSLQQGNALLAIEYWKLALKKIPNDNLNKDNKQRLSTLIKSYE